MVQYAFGRVRLAVCSGIRCSPQDRLVLGSEGTMGVVTGSGCADLPVSAPDACANALGAASTDYKAGRVRAPAQSGLYPSNCRLRRPDGDRVSGVVMAPQPRWCWALSQHPMNEWMRRRTGAGLCSYGGSWRRRIGRERSDAPDDGAVKSAPQRHGLGAWRQAFPAHAPLARPGCGQRPHHGHLRRPPPPGTSLEAFGWRVRKDVAQASCSRPTGRTRRSRVPPLHAPSYPDGPGAPLHHRGLGQRAGRCGIGPVVPGDRDTPAVSQIACACACATRYGNLITPPPQPCATIRPLAEQRTPRCTARMLRAMAKATW